MEMMEEHSVQRAFRQSDYHGHPSPDLREELEVKWIEAIRGYLKRGMANLTFAVQKH